MINFFKKKLFVLLLILSATFCFAPTQVAHAGGVLSFLTGGASDLINAVVSGNVNYLGIFIPGSFTGVACVAGLICGSSSSGGVTIMPPAAATGSCNYQVPVTFYIPQMNISYYQPTVWNPNANCTGGDGWSPQVCTGGYTPSGAFAPDPSFNETNRQIAIYRFAIPSNSSQATINDWFINQIKTSVGNGWKSKNDIWHDYQSSEPAPLVTLPYSQLCSGNVCHFNDASVPQNSYVAYAAKILGSYTYFGMSLDTNNMWGIGASSVILATADNKFLNNDNNANSAFFPLQNGNNLGNAIAGPYQLGTAACPTCSNSAVNYPACTIKNDGTCINGANNPPTCTTFLPTVNNVTISSSSIVVNATTPYTITVTASDPAGGSDLTNAFALINLQGVNASVGNYRGYTMWSSNNLSPWGGPSILKSAPISCSGGGSAGIYNGYGPQYINLLSCSTSVSGNTRTTSFVVTFNTNFTSPVANNTLSGYAYTASNQNSGWSPFGIFGIVNNCADITSVCNTVIPYGGCWNGSAWVNGNTPCGTACSGGVCAIDNGCAANTCTGNICWNSYAFVNGTKVCDNHCADITSVCNTVIPYGGCWNGSAWVNGNMPCSTACSGGVCAVDNGCAANNCPGNVCWNGGAFVNGTKDCSACTPVPGCPGDFCTGTQCFDAGCNLINGTKTGGACCVSNGCEATTCTSRTCDNGCSANAAGTKVCASGGIWREVTP